MSAFVPSILQNLVLSLLVLLEHHLVHDPAEQRNHAEVPENHEEEQEGRQDVVAPHDVVEGQEEGVQHELELGDERLSQLHEMRLQITDTPPSAEAAAICQRITGMLSDMAS